MKVPAIIALVAGAAALSACDRAQFESPPVTISTDGGNVVCQLYTYERVLWDEAIAFPSTMDKTMADMYCRAEGERRLRS